MANITLLSRGTGGDIYPFIKIGKALKTRGHEVVLLTNHKFVSKVEESGLSGVSLDDLTTYDDWAGEHGETPSRASWLRYVVYKNVLLYKVVERYCTAETLLISHYELHVIAQMISDKLGIPYLPVLPSPHFIQAAPRLVDHYTSTSAFVNELRRDVGLGPIEDWQSWLSAPRSGMGFWPSWFGEPDQSWLLDVEPVGFVRDESVETGPLPSSVEEELQTDAAPILITHATSRPTDAAFFEASIEACRLLGRKAIVVTSDSDLIDDAPAEFVQTFEYLPFASLMPRMSAVIHHGGIGTSGQALNSGVPQLVLPLGYDRNDNAARLKQLGVADFLLQPEWQPHAIAEALSRLLSSAEVNARCRELAHISKAGDSVSAACAYIESLN